MVGPLPWRFIVSLEAVVAKSGLDRSCACTKLVELWADMDRRCRTNVEISWIGRIFRDFDVRGML